MPSIVARISIVADEPEIDVKVSDYHNFILQSSLIQALSTDEVCLTIHDYNDSKKRLEAADALKSFLNQLSTNKMKSAYD